MSSKAVKRSNCSTVLSDFGCSANSNLIFTMIEIIITAAVSATNISLCFYESAIANVNTDLIE